jgi:colanic acid/amylovoran biosynthesis glycosyltransferase
MKILYVTASLPFGKGEAFLLPELRELRERGHEVMVIPACGRGKRLHAGVREIQFIEPGLLSSRILLRAAQTVVRNPIGAARNALGLLRSGSLRVLVANLAIFPKALWLAYFAAARQVDHIHGAWASTPATMAMIAGRLSGVDWSFSAHGWDIRQPNLLHRKIGTAKFARFISHHGMQVAGSRYGNPVVVHLGQTLPPNSHVPVPRPLQILCPANLIVVKGHAYLLQAAAALRTRGIPFALRLAGDGDLRRQLEEQVHQLGLGEHVRFLGHLAHQDLMAEYECNAVDVTVLASLHEGIPVSLMEAMAHGVPVVATAVGGVSELLRGGAGMLVPPRNPDALAHALEQLAKDVELSASLSRAGRMRVEQEFDVAHTAARMAALMGGQTVARHRVQEVSSSHKSS